MTENPYAPPTAELAGNEGFGSAAGTGDFDIGLCVSEAWAGTWANFPLWLGAGLVLTVLMMLSTLTVVGLLLAVPHLAFGATYFFLRMHDREAEFGDIFAGFSDYGRVLVNMVVAFLILMVLQIIANALYWAGGVTENTTLMVVGYMISLAFSLLVAPRLYLAYFYIVDQDATGVDAMRTSWERTDVSKWKCLGLVLLTGVITIAGMLALVVGVFPAMVMAYLMWASAFRQIEGRTASA